MKTFKALNTLLVCATVLLSACAPATPQIIRETVEVPIQQTVEVTVKETVVVPEAAPTDVPFDQKDQITLVHNGTPGALTSHPWTAMVEEYNRLHPEVHVTLQLVPGDYWQVFGTWVASGNMPDLMRATPAGMMQNKANIPWLVSATDFITEEDKADFGNALAGVTMPDGTVLGIPMSRNFGDWPCVDKALLEAALPKIGLATWQDIYERGGWTFDEWNTVAQHMTVDVNGKHPTDAGFDENNVKTWAFVIWRSYANSIPTLIALNNGVPDASSGVGMMWWGNSYNWTGPKVVDALQMWQDWHTKYKIATPSTLALQSDTETYQGVARGEFASTWDFPDWCRSVIRDYNDSVDAGEVAGEKVDREMVVLPLPRAKGFPGGHIDRSVVLSIFKQEPSKGDEHTQNVVEFAKWLTTTENLLKYCEWASAVPARASAAEQFAPLKDDENIKMYFEYALKTANPTFPFSHPIYSRFRDDALTPVLEALANGSIKAKAADQQLVETADQLVDEWVSVTDPAIVAFYAQPPSGWPGPKYPDWTIRRPKP